MCYSIPDETLHQVCGAVDAAAEEAALLAKTSDPPPTAVRSPDVSTSALGGMGGHELVSLFSAMSMAQKAAVLDDMQAAERERVLEAVTTAAIPSAEARSSLSQKHRSF